MIRRRLIVYLGLFIALAIAPAAALSQVPGDDETPAANPTSRPAPRPILADQQYTENAATLRAAYARPADQWPKPTLEADVKFTELGPIPKPEFPKENPFSQPKADLGKMLFFDPRLSGSGQIACASCHESELGWGDGKAVSFGHKRQALSRNTPSLNNVGLRQSLFWDGRAKTLEQQAAQPIADSLEMAANPADIVKTINSVEGYRKHFKDIFNVDTITMELIASAIATYERTLTSRTSDFDRFLKGDPNVLSDAAVRGLHLFRTDARCINCHNGPLFSDDQFHNVGLSYYGRTLQDLGLYEITRKAEDVGKFRTPSLRNISRTGPYMHNGLFELEGVLRMYNAGMPTLRPKATQLKEPLFPTKSHLLKPLALNKHDLADLKAFLDSLEETRLRVRPPELPAR